MVKQPVLISQLSVFSLTASTNSTLSYYSHEVFKLVTLGFVLDHASSNQISNKLFRIVG